MTNRGWFADIDIADTDAGAERINVGSAERPANWPTIAQEAGLVADQDAYHARLRAAALVAFDHALEALAAAADRELVQLIRTHDGVVELANELDQRIAEAIAETGITLEEADIPLAARLRNLRALAEDLEAETARLAEETSRHAHAVAPNLAALAGPMLAARLVAEAGSLEALARKPSSTLQVLGAESALFVHLRGDAPSPKHGVIFTHPAVRSAPRDARGRIARTLAGKLTIAARIDHYRGELDPSLADDLDDRLTEAAGGGGR